MSEAIQNLLIEHNSVNCGKFVCVNCSYELENTINERQSWWPNELIIIYFVNIIDIYFTTFLNLGIYNVIYVNLDYYFW